MFTFVIDLFTIYWVFFKSLPWTYQFSKVTTVTLQTFLLCYAGRYGGNGAGEGGGAVRDGHIDAGSTLYSIINESSDITASYLSCQRDVAVFYLIIMSFG